MTYQVDSKQVIYADLDVTEGVLLHLGTKYYYRLNETGQLIWRGLSIQKSSESIVTELVDTYEISEAEAKADVDNLVQQLRTEQLLTQEKKAPDFSVRGAQESKRKGR